MFVIADNRHKPNPSYVRNIGKDGSAYISISLNDALIFATKKEANEAFATIKKTAIFEFGVFPLGIIA